MNSIWKLFGRSRAWRFSKETRQPVKLEELLKTYDPAALIAELNSFALSKVFEALQAFLANERTTHEELMHQAIGHSNLHCEASYEAGCYKSLKYVQEFMLPEFIAYVKSGGAPGVIDGSPPEEEADS